MLSIYNLAIRLQSSSTCQWTHENEVHDLLHHIASERGVPHAHLRIAIAEAIDEILRSRLDDVWVNLNNRLTDQRPQKVRPVFHALLLQHLLKFDRRTVTRTDAEREWYSLLTKHIDELRHVYTDSLTESIEQDIAQL